MLLKTERPPMRIRTIQSAAYERDLFVTDASRLALRKKNVRLAIWQITAVMAMRIRIERDNPVPFRANQNHRIQHVT